MSSLESCSSTWRKGTWANEEKLYADMLIACFQVGYAPDCERLTMRCYVAQKLHCDPMRVSKKFAGIQGLGLRINAQRGLSKLTCDQVTKMKESLERKRLDFLVKEAEIEESKKRKFFRRGISLDASGANVVYDSEFDGSLRKKKCSVSITGDDHATRTLNLSNNTNSNFSHCGPAIETFNVQESEQWYLTGNSSLSLSSYLVSDGDVSEWQKLFSEDWLDENHPNTDDIPGSPLDPSVDVSFTASSAYEAADTPNPQLYYV